MRRRLVALAAIAALAAGIAASSPPGLLTSRALASGKGGGSEAELLEVACRSNQHDGELVTLEICERKLMVTEFTRDWRRIHWRPDLTSAVAESKTSGKPIFVFFSVLEYSQESSPFT
jgi:hypothetical protein